MSDQSDRIAIERIYIRYCSVIDCKDFDRFDEIFTADTFGDYTQAYGADAVRHGRDELVAIMKQNLGESSNCGATHHNVLNIEIDVNGDSAAATVNYYAVHRGVRDHEGALYSMWGRYHDDLVRTDNGWRIARRRYMLSLSEGPVVTSVPR